MKAKRGRILRIQMGYNPNSSALAGVLVTCLWASTIGGTVAVMMDGWLRRGSGTRGKPGSGPKDKA